MTVAEALKVAELLPCANCTEFGVAAEALAAEVRRLTDLVKRAKLVLLRTARGTCWCEKGIGNPMMSTHSPGCVDAKAWLADARTDRQ